MADNVCVIREGVQPSADPEREILIHVQEKLTAMKANGISPVGIVFVLFGDDAEQKQFSSAHWMTAYMEGSATFAAAYAALKIQQEIFE